MTWVRANVEALQRGNLAVKWRLMQHNRLVRSFRQRFSEASRARWNLGGRELWGASRSDPSGDMRAHLEYTGTWGAQHGAVHGQGRHQ